MSTQPNDHGAGHAGSVFPGNAQDTRHSSREASDADPAGREDGSPGVRSGCEDDGVAGTPAGRKAGLRGAIEKWLSADAANPVQVACTGRTRSGGVPYVEVRRVADAIAMFFFRHRDGSWQVYPPA